jgi:hypothetical protein
VEKKEIKQELPERTTKVLVQVGWTLKNHHVQLSALVSPEE